MSYHKINSFKRDNKNNVTNLIVDPEVSYMKNLPWVAQEKVDGTNICFHCLKDEDNEWLISTQGRHVTSDIPGHLQIELDAMVPDLYVGLKKVFAELPAGTEVDLYGEGYGNKIGPKGKLYVADKCKFIMFDYTINGKYGTPDAAKELATALDLPFVPVIGTMTIQEAIDYVSANPDSQVAESKVEMEGLVLKNPLGMLSRNGSPLTIKVKIADLRNLKEKLIV